MTEKFNKWNILKQKLHKSDKKINIKERNIYYMSVGQNIGSEQYGKGEKFLRPVIVYKKLGNNYFLGIPLTSQVKEGSYYFTFNRKNGKKNSAMLNQIRTFDKKRIVSYNGKISKNTYKNLKAKLEEFIDSTLTESEGVPTRAKTDTILSQKNDFVNSNKNILITGGVGFIGSNFISYFLNKYPNYNIINLDLLTYAGNLENLKEIENNPRYKFIKGDICNRELVEYIFNKFNIIGVIHFAAESHVDNSITNPEKFIETNINGTFTLLDIAYKYWKKHSQLLRFLHISTDEVYGSLGNTGLFTEKTPYAPNSPYSASKASSDMLVRSYNKTYGLNTVITNCSNNYGPKQHNEKLIPTIIRNAINGNPIPIYGDGKNIRDWLYVLDHCKGIDLAFHKGKSGETYNIGGKNERTNLEIANKICEILDKLYPPIQNSKLKTQNYKDLIVFVDDRAGHDKRYAIDASKLENELGWKANENFDTGIVKTIKWYLEKYEIAQ